MSRRGISQLNSFGKCATLYGVSPDGLGARRRSSWSRWNGGRRGGAVAVGTRLSCRFRRMQVGCKNVPQAAMLIAAVIKYRVRGIAMPAALHHALPPGRAGWVPEYNYFSEVRPRSLAFSGVILTHLPSGLRTLILRCFLFFADGGRVNFPCGILGIGSTWTGDWGDVSSWTVGTGS